MWDFIPCFRINNWQMSPGAMQFTSYIHGENDLQCDAIRWEQFCRDFVFEALKKHFGVR